MQNERPKDKEGTIIDMTQGVTTLMLTMKKKLNGEGNLMKIGAKMWQSLSYLM